jgi:hypothetical protein
MITKEDIYRLELLGKVGLTEVAYQETHAEKEDPDAGLPYEEMRDTLNKVLDFLHSQVGITDNKR